jgi:long-chain acyl-CoA synthetase
MRGGAGRARHPKGVRVALLMPNIPHAIITQLGVWKAGAIVMPINPLSTAHKLQRLLTECGAETVVVLTPFYAKIKAVQAQTNLYRIIVARIKDDLPPGLRFMFTACKEQKEGHRIALQPGDLWLHELLRRIAAVPRPAVPVSPHDPALLLFTGGTTGEPKGAVGTHHALVIAGQQLHAWFRGELVDWDDVLLLLMPLFHVYGNVAVLATGLVGHNPLALVPNPRDIDDVVATIRTTRPAFVPGVPTLFIALLSHRRAGQHGACADNQFA